MESYPHFSEFFWDQDLVGTTGFDALVRRLKDGRKLCKDFEEYYRQRSKIEGQYMKDLQKLTKNMDYRQDRGVLEKTWNELRTQTENISHHHETAAGYFWALMSDLERLNDNLKIRGKQIEERTSKSHNLAKGCLTKHNQLKKSYEQKCIDYSSIRQDTKSNEVIDQKSLQKQKLKEQKAKDEMEKTDCLYRTSVDSLQNAQRKWEEDFENACKIYRELDIERITELRDIIWKGTNVDSQMCVDHDMCCEYTRNHLEKCDIQDELITFVDRARVGHLRPVHTYYQNYFKGTGLNNRKLSGTSDFSEESIYQSVT